MASPTQPVHSMARRGALAMAVATVFLAGCVNYAGIKSDKQIASSDTYQAKQSLPGDGGRWPSLGWASEFGDPQLPQLVAEALEGNPSIAQTQARIAKAQSFIESSRSSLFPRVDGSYSWTRERLSANGFFPPAFESSDSSLSPSSSASSPRCSSTGSLREIPTAPDVAMPSTSPAASAGP